MTCDEIMTELRTLAPETLACAWDNPGLLIGRRDKEVKKVLVVVDVTERVIENAAAMQADLIVSHHPLIFSGIKKINGDDVFGRRILELIRHDIAVYAMHTNYDIAAGGMGDQAAKVLELTDVSVLADQVVYRNAAGEEVCGGIGRVGTLKAPMTVREFAAFVRERFDRHQVVLFGDPDSEKKITRIAVCPGAGKDDMDAALLSGADLYLTGDITHHVGLDAAEQGLFVIDAGHYGIEHIFIPAICDFLASFVDPDVEVIPYLDGEPFVFL